MDNKLLCLFVCIAFVGYANALECYSCLTKEACEKEQSMWDKTECGKSTGPNIQPVCAKVTYKDKATNKDYMLRKCALATKNAEGVFKYECAAAPNGNPVVNCESCTTSWCNSAPHTKISIFTVALVALVAFVPTYF